MQTRPLDLDLLKPERYPALHFDEDAWLWFEGACVDFGIAMPEKIRSTLEVLYSHLVGVNEWLNLTRLTTPSEYLKFHVFDSLTACSLIAEITDPGDLCVDLGSGGGYPGLPFAIWLPDRRWRLVDSRGRKVAFLSEAVRLTPCRNIRAQAFRGREAASAAPDLAGACSLVVARAVGRAAKLLEEAAPLLDLGGALVLLKGPSYEREERDEAQNACEELGFDMVSEDTVSLDEEDPGRFIVVFAKTGEGQLAPRARRRKRR
ncbi:MAG: 16S rRNA (guanine(527)-N(7))-methyltransferase RsmG [Lentisphaeria bacterium]|nr:16S rRNA (guanine(527)-N(7))-methyltransferase RsmG [Lentisphaeria bacterium]